MTYCANYPILLLCMYVCIYVYVSMYSRGVDNLPYIQEVVVTHCSNYPILPLYLQDRPVTMNGRYHAVTYCALAVHSCTQNCFGDVSWGVPTIPVYTIVSKTETYVQLDNETWIPSVQRRYDARARVCVCARKQLLWMCVLMCSSIRICLICVMFVYMFRHLIHTHALNYEEKWDECSLTKKTHIKRRIV
jgi:hypothetical protein